MGTQKPITTIPDEYVELRKLSLPALSACRTVELYRDDYAHNRKTHWATLVVNLNSLQRKFEFLLHEARTDPRADEIVKLLYHYAANEELTPERKRQKIVGESNATGGFARSLCEFKGKYEQENWDDYAKMRKDQERGPVLIEKVLHWQEFWKEMGYTHVTPGMLFDPIREDKKYEGCGPIGKSRAKLPVVVMAGLIRDLQADGRIAKDFVSTGPSFFDRMPRIVPDGLQAKVVAEILEDADKDDLFK